MADLFTSNILSGVYIFSGFAGLEDPESYNKSYNAYFILLH